MKMKWIMFGVLGGISIANTNNIENIKQEVEILQAKNDQLTEQFYDNLSQRLDQENWILEDLKLKSNQTSIRIFDLYSPRSRSYFFEDGDVKKLIYCLPEVPFCKKLQNKVNDLFLIKAKDNLIKKNKALEEYLAK